MATYFLDTSAIVKRYYPEQGHVWVKALCDPIQRHSLFISQAALVEVVAALCRREREHNISTPERDRLIARFRQHCQAAYNVWQVTDAVYTRAGNLCRSHRLRGYDAVQLACLLDVRDDALAIRAPAPMLVCADNNLINIAIAEGLNVDNPNNYP